MKEGPFIDRKTMRKENRKLKKQKKEIYYKKLKPLEKTQIPTPPPPTKKISKTKQNTQKNQETIALESTINLDDQMIRKYEKKLGISKNSKKEDKFQKEMMQDGLDHSFFRLLDKIHSSTNKPLENYKSYAYSDDEEDENEVSNNSAEINEEEEDASFKEEFNEVEESFSEEESILSGEERILSEEEKDFSSSVEEKEKVLIISQKVSKSKKPILKKNNIPMTHERNAILMETNKEAIQKTLKKNPPLSNKISQELKEKKAMIIEKDTSSEIVKKIQSNLNKLSEGNIENIFTQIVFYFNKVF